MVKGAVIAALLICISASAILQTAKGKNIPGFSYEQISVETSSPVHPNNHHYIVLDVEHVDHEARYTGEFGVGIVNLGSDGIIIRKGLIPGIVASDEFRRRKGERALPLVWQWNHNPDNSLWSVAQRKGYLQLTTGRIDTLFVAARNTLTKRTFGPVCSGSASIDVSKLNSGFNEKL